MPRTAQASVGGMTYHALNLGQPPGASFFHKRADYGPFAEAIADVRHRLPEDIFGYCLMPNHFYLVVCPHGDGDLGRWMRWLLTAHAPRCRRHHKTSGHVWQGRRTTPRSVVMVPEADSQEKGKIKKIARDVKKLPIISVIGRR